MTTRTMYHVTDAEHADSIQSEGVQPQRPGGKTFYMDSEPAARDYGELMPTISDAVVFEVEVMEHALQPDSEEPGDFPAFEKRGGVAAHNVALLD
jgi:hypothetical protein